MKRLCILALFAWSSFAAAADAPLGVPLKELFDNARYEEFMPAAERLAAAGNAEAQFLLGKAYHLRKGADEDLSRAFDLYEKAARNGNWRAIDSIGTLVLRDGRHADKAAALFQRALDLGGDDTVRDNLNTAHWTLCTEDGNTAACAGAAKAYLAEWKRTGAIEPFNKALDALSAGCESAAPPNTGESGQAELPPRNACAEAIALSERGAAGGSLPATHARARLAAMVGDDQTMLTWLKRAADAGYVKSSEQLGALYAGGEGVPADEEQARQWFEKAAAAGSRNAASWLTDYWEETARNTTDRDKVKSALDELVRLNPGQERDDFDAAIRLDYLGAFAHNAQHGPLLKKALSRTICVPELEDGRVRAWKIHALDGPDADEHELDGLASKAQGKTGKSGCLRLGPEAARNVHAMFTRGETPLLAVADRHYMLLLGPAGTKVRTVTPTPHPHMHTHGCGCSH